MFELVIHSLAGKEVADTLTNVNMIMNTTGFKYYVGIGALIGFIYFLIRYVTSDADFGKEGRTFMVIYVLIFGFLMPRTDVHVHDITRGATYIVGDTSLGLGFIASAITNITYWKTRITATAYSTPTSSIDPYSMNGGYLSPIQYIYLLREIALSKSPIEKSEGMLRLSNNLTRYMNGCYIPYLEKNNVANAEMHTAQKGDLWGGMFVPMYGWTVEVKQLEIQGEIQSGYATCPDAYQALSKELMLPYVKEGLIDHLINATRSSLAIVDPSIDANGQTRSISLQRAYYEDMMESVLFGDSTVWVLNSEGETFSDGILTAIDSSALDGGGNSSISNMESDPAGALMRNLYLFRIFNTASGNYFSRKVGINAYQSTLFDGITHKNLSMANSAWSFGQYMIPVIGFIEVLIYSLLPMAIFLMLALGVAGIKTVSMYIMAFFWVALWPYSYILIHHWIVGKFIDSMDDFFQAGSVYEISTMLQAAQNQLGAGGMWIGLVPLITLFIVKGSMYTFNSIATQIQGSEKMNEDNMHRKTYESQALYNMSGDQMAAERFAHGLSMGVGNNAYGYEKGMQTSYNVGNQVKAAVSYQEGVEQRASHAFQGSVGDSVSYALSGKMSSDNKWGFQLNNSSSYSDVNSGTFKSATRVAEQLGLNISKDSMQQLNASFAAGVAGQLGFNANANLAHSSADLEKAGITEEQHRAMVTELSKDENYRKAWTSEAKLSKDESFNESIASAEEKRLQAQLSETHDLSTSASEKLDHLNSISNSMDMAQTITSDGLGNAIVNSKQQNPEVYKQWTELVSQPEVQRLTEQKIDDAAFRNIWGNNVYGTMGEQVSGEKAIRLSAQMEAVRESAYLQSDPTKVAEMISVYSSSGAFNAEGATTQPSESQAVSYVSSIGGDVQPLVDTRKQVSMDANSVADTVKQAAEDASQKLEKIEVPTEEAVSQNQHVQQSSNRVNNADDYLSAKETHANLMNKSEQSYENKMKQDDRYREMTQIEATAREMNISIPEAHRNAAHSAVMENPVIDGYINAMQESSNPQVRQQAERIEDVSERLAKEIKAGEMSYETFADYNEEFAKGSAMWSAHGIEMAKESVTEKVMDAYMDDRGDKVSPDLRERYENAGSYEEKASIILEASPEYKFGDDIDASMQKLMANQLQEEGRDFFEKAFDGASPLQVFSTAVTDTDLDFGAAIQLHEEANILLDESEATRGNQAGFIHRALMSNEQLAKDSIHNSYQEAVDKYRVEPKEGFAHLPQTEQVEWLAQNHPRYVEAMEEEKAEHGGQLPTRLFSDKPNYNGVMERVVDSEYSSGDKAVDAAMELATKPDSFYLDLAEHYQDSGKLTQEQAEEIKNSESPAEKASLFEKYLGGQDHGYLKTEEESLTRAEQALSLIQRLDREASIVNGEHHLEAGDSLLKELSSVISKSREGDSSTAIRDQLISLFASSEITQYLIGKELEEHFKDKGELPIEALSKDSRESMQALISASPEMKAVYDKQMEKRDNEDRAMHAVYEALLAKHG